MTLKTMVAAAASILMVVPGLVNAQEAHASQSPAAAEEHFKNFNEFIGGFQDVPIITLDPDTVKEQLDRFFNDPSMAAHDLNSDMFTPSGTGT